MSDWRRLWRWFTGRHRPRRHLNAIDVSIRARDDELTRLAERVRAYEDQVEAARALAAMREGDDERHR